MGIGYYLRRIDHELTNRRERARHATMLSQIGTLLASCRDCDNENPCSIVYVCTGNICRSAYAHHALRSLLAENGISNIRVASVGIATTPGKKANDTAKEVAQKRGVDLSPHITALPYRDLLLGATVILLMEPSHKRALQSIAPEVADRMFLAGHLAGEQTNAIIDDPYGRSTEEFERCFDLLDTVNTTILGFVSTQDESAS